MSFRSRGRVARAGNSKGSSRTGIRGALAKAVRHPTAMQECLGNGPLARVAQSRTGRPLRACPSYPTVLMSFGPGAAIRKGRAAGGGAAGSG